MLKKVPSVDLSSPGQPMELTDREVLKKKNILNNRYINRYMLQHMYNPCASNKVVTCACSTYIEAQMATLCTKVLATEECWPPYPLISEASDLGHESIKY